MRWYVWKYLVPCSGPGTKQVLNVSVSLNIITSTLCASASNCLSCSGKEKFVDTVVPPCGCPFLSLCRLLVLFPPLECYLSPSFRLPPASFPPYTHSPCEFISSSETSYLWMTAHYVLDTLLGIPNGCYNPVRSRLLSPSLQLRSQMVLLNVLPPVSDGVGMWCRS